MPIYRAKSLTVRQRPRSAGTSFTKANNLLPWINLICPGVCLLRPQGTLQLWGSAGFRSRLASADLPSSFPTMSTLQEIEAAALRLPDKDRLHLADKILGSLPAPLAPAEPEEILAEAIRRDAELESGEVLPLTEGAFWAGVRRRSA